MSDVTPILPASPVDSDWLKPQVNIYHFSQSSSKLKRLWPLGRMGWLVAVHSGAGRYGHGDHEAAYLGVMREALACGRSLMTSDHDQKATTRAVAVACRVLSVFERSDVTNAGRGANLTEARRVECEASVVCGNSGLTSACAGMRGVVEPSALAFELLQAAQSPATGSQDRAMGRQPPLVVVGEHARTLAQQFGLETANEADELETFQVTAQAEAYWTKWHNRLQAADNEQEPATGEDDIDQRLDTVGVICIDPEGNVASALSSGGIAYKVPGRVGLAGCPRMGCNASNARQRRRHKRPRSEAAISSSRSGDHNAFAVACTGRGEHFIRSGFVSALSHRLRKTEDLERAIRYVT